MQQQLFVYMRPRYEKLRNGRVDQQIDIQSQVNSAVIAWQWHTFLSLVVGRGYQYEQANILIRSSRIPWTFAVSMLTQQTDLYFSIQSF